jgi:hypothetical protein
VRRFKSLIKRKIDNSMKKGKQGKAEECKEQHLETGKPNRNSYQTAKS